MTAGSPGLDRLTFCWSRPFPRALIHGCFQRAPSRPVDDAVRHLPHQPAVLLLLSHLPCLPGVLLSSPLTVTHTHFVSLGVPVLGSLASPHAPCRQAPWSPSWLERQQLNGASSFRTASPLYQTWLLKSRSFEVLPAQHPSIQCSPLSQNRSQVLGPRDLYRETLLGDGARRVDSDRLRAFGPRGLALPPAPESSGAVGGS